MSSGVASIAGTIPGMSLVAGTAKSVAAQTKKVCLKKWSRFQCREKLQKQRRAEMKQEKNMATKHVFARLNKMNNVIENGFKDLQVKLGKIKEQVDVLQKIMDKIEAQAAEERFKRVKKNSRKSHKLF